MIKALHTDQYCVTMSQSYWRHEQDMDMTTFELFARKLPKSKEYLLVAGVADVMNYLENFKFTDDDLNYLRGLGLYEEKFLSYLSNLKFTGELIAIPEGTVISNEVPIIKIRAPRVQATLVESAIISIINQQTLIATKVSKIVEAASGREVWDFSLRRLHGPTSSVGVARAAYIAGASGTATLEAGKELGLPTTGTMAHAFVQSFGRGHEVEAFKQFLIDYPGNGVLLVDTYDTKQGILNAIQAAQETGISLRAIRLDSGDLYEDSIWARKTLDNAGFKETKIIASNDLDEYSIKKLVDRQVPAALDSFGVGTRLGIGASPNEEEIPALGLVYKIVSQEKLTTKNTSNDLQFEGSYPVMKFAEGKETNPGAHEVWRVISENGIKDTISLEGEELAGVELMRTYMRNGKIIQPELNNLQQIRDRATRELSQLKNRSIYTNRSEKLENLIKNIKKQVNSN